MPKTIDLKGKKFGDWTANKYLGNSKWECEDSQGNIKIIHSYELRNHYNENTKPKGLIPEGFLNKKFNSWYVNEYLGNGFWDCICDCGNHGKVNSFDLKNNRSKQCIQCSKMKNLIDISGKTFGNWYVDSYAGDMKWNCICQCDKHTNRKILGRYLRDGTSISCGCMTNNHKVIKDISNKIFGYLEVIEYTGKDNIWKCKCLACGKQDVYVNRDSLISEKTKSCGCMKEELRKNTLTNRYGDNNTTRINNPRNSWQIETISNKASLLQFIQSMEYKPTAYELSELLDVHDTTMLKALRKFELMEYIQDVNSGTSAMEIQILEFVKQFGYTVEQRNKTVLKGLELDIYIPEKALAIEFNGNYWHSTIFKDSKYHQNKTIQCIKNGIHLIHIFEYEWLDSNKRDKIKNYISSLLCSNTKIYGRKTYIKEIELKESEDFLNKYHLQGSVKSEIRLACIYENEIIGIMTFGEPRFSSDYEYELIRLCWKQGYTVIGGSEKLLKYFITKYNPISILSYCDLTKFSGEVYLRLGFKTSKDMLTKPNYVWIKQGTSEILTRYQTQKHKLIEQGLGTKNQTEDEILHNLGYMKIYNSGNIKFVWKKC